MRQTKEQISAELLREVAAMIEGWAEWCESTERPSLAQIEEAALRVRQEFGQRLAEKALEVQEAQRPFAEPHCPQCKQRLRNKGQKEIQIESRLGLVEVKRGYYWCAGCGTGFFPSGSAADFGGESLE